MRLLSYLCLLLAASLIALVSLGGIGPRRHPKPVHTAAATPGYETVYITNLAPQFISDRQIRHDIPAWQHAVNHDFYGYWHTTRYRLVFQGRKPAPPGQISAEFLSKGPIKGALAYHWIERGDAPSITVYAGTGDYYGFDNSVSFTHELFELAADPVTSYVNQGYPYDYYWIEHLDLSIDAGVQAGVVGWFNEVSDPVEADFYRIGDVEISDFVTPAWFNDGVGQRYDFLGLCQQPFWIRPGGYAQYLDAFGWQMVTNFRKAHPSDRGFVKSDPRGRGRKAGKR